MEGTKLVRKDILREKLKQNIKGGYDGLEFFFEHFINECNSNKWELNHAKFEDFVNGNQIIVLGADYAKTGSPYEFENFYERRYKFSFTSDVITFTDNVLQYVINRIEELFLDDNFNENEKIQFIRETLMSINIEIEKSIYCKEEENPRLYSKVIYLKNGYIEIYNKIFDIYGHYLIGFEKVDFTELEKESIYDKQDAKNINKTIPWFEVGLLYAEGKIQEFIKNNPKLSAPKIAEHFKNMKYEKYILATNNNYKTDKDIFHCSKKINEIVEHCKSNDVAVCEDFKKKYDLVK